jgi:predicted glycoside hydrolase/deacetylase ChbG (UPF0249 family)
VSRVIVVNADDYGRTEGVNRGIVEAHERGIVTSASLMVRWPAAREAAAYVRDVGRLGLGLHVDLGEWVFRGGRWQPVYEVVPLDDSDAVAAEVGRQLAAFRELIGCEPDHLDSHQHVHREEPACGIFAGHGRELGMPVRHLTEGVRYCGDFFGQTGEGEPLAGALSVGALVDIISALPEGITELACHPGYARGLDSAYREEREREIAALCDPRVRQAVAAGQVELRTFGELAV